MGHFFRERRGIATGVATTGGSVGGVVFPLMLQRMFEHAGWAWSIRALAFICLACCAVANCLIRSRLPPARGASPHPDIRILGNAAFLFTTTGVFLLELGLFIPLTYISSYAIAQGFPETFGLRVLPIMNAASIVGRALPGYWGDRFGPLNSNITMTVLCGVSCLAIWLPVGSTTAGLIAFVILFGFASGSNIGLTPVCIGRLCKTQEYGRYYATCYTVVSIACLISVPIGGNILTACGGKYWGLVLFTGLAYIMALGSFLIARWAQVGRRIKANL